MPVPVDPPSDPPDPEDAALALDPEPAADPAAAASDAAAAETDIRALAAAGDTDAATARLIRHYGAELLGFLSALAHDSQLATEAFALACEQIWRGLPRFRWQSAVRTWAYQVARNALYQLRREPARRRERNLPLSVMSSIEAVPRSPTPVHRRTAVKEAMRLLRESLAPEDHELLLLRLDRAMSWKDIARATATEADADEPGPRLDQRAAALRKRFERVKAQLRQLAVERGLLD
jgi:RNA polymerase sigma-70 factor, ECF subfamily